MNVDIAAIHLNRSQCDLQTQKSGMISDMQLDLELAFLAFFSKYLLGNAGSPADA